MENPVENFYLSNKKNVELTEIEWVVEDFQEIEQSFEICNFQSWFA